MRGRTGHGASVAILLGPVELLRSAMCAAMLAGIAVLAYELTAANLDDRFAGFAAVLLPTALVGWALWNPASSDVRMWIVDTLVVAARVVLAYAVAVSLVNLWRVGFAIGPWVALAWTQLVVIPVAWLVQRAILVRVASSARAEEARAALPS